MKQRPLSLVVGARIAMAMLALFVVLGVLVVQTVDRSLERELHEKSSALAAQLATVSIDALLLRDYGTIERYVQALPGERDLVFVEIRRADGEVLGSAGEHTPSAPTVTAPMALGIERLGEVTVQYDRSRIRTLAWQIAGFLVVTLLALYGVSFLVLKRVLQRSVVGPLDQLLAALHPDRPGKLTPPDGAPQEIADLASRFNALKQRVDEHIVALDQMHQQQNEAMRRLCSEQRLASLGQMAAQLAHELNTPLSNILGYAQLVGEDLQDAEARRKLGVIEEQARRAGGIVQDMLAAARAPAPQAQAIALTPVLERFARLIGPLLRKQHAALVVEPAEPDRCWADPAMLEQILFNLIGNALQAGAKQVVLRIASETVGPCLDIEDDGAGVAPEVRERVFDAFVTSRAAAGGTGLGLAISRKLAESMRGTLMLAQSEPGRTVFRLCLPGEIA